MAGPIHNLAARIAETPAMGAVAWFGSDAVETPSAESGPVDNAMQAIANHAGLSAAAGAGLVLAVGLIALVAGGRMARPMLAALAAAVGAVLGALAPASLFAAAGADESWRIGAMVVGAAIFGAGGVALFRPAMAISGAAAGSVAAAGVLALMTLLGARMPIELPGATSPTLRTVSTDGEVTSAARDAAGKAAGEAFARDRFAKLMGDSDDAGTNETVVGALANAAQAGWQAIPQQARLTIRVGLLAGAVIGLVFGALWPRRAAGAVASLLGAAGVVAAGLALGVVAGVGGAWSAADVACGSLVAWLALAMLGAMMQASRKSASDAAPQAA
jgi:hypothetical protein